MGGEDVKAEAKEEDEKPELEMPPPGPEEEDDEEGDGDEEGDAPDGYMDETPADSKEQTPAAEERVETPGGCDITEDFKPQIEEDIKPVIEEDVKPTIPTDVKPDLKTWLGADTKPDIKPDVKLDVKPVIHPVVSAYAAAEKSVSMLSSWLGKNVDKKPDIANDGRTLILIGTYSIGKERIVKGKLAASSFQLTIRHREGDRRQDLLQPAQDPDPEVRRRPGAARSDGDGPEGVPDPPRAVVKHHARQSGRVPRHDASALQPYSSLPTYGMDVLGTECSQLSPRCQLHHSA